MTDEESKLISSMLRGLPDTHVVEYGSANSEGDLYAIVSFDRSVKGWRSLAVLSFAVVMTNNEEGTTDFGATSMGSRACNLAAGMEPDDAFATFRLCFEFHLKAGVDLRALAKLIRGLSHDVQVEVDGERYSIEGVSK